MSHGGPPRPDRRAWLVGAVSLAACATPPSPARSPAPLDARALSETGLTEDEALLIALAALAPSRHNEQPWTVRVDAPFRWTVSLDPSRRLGAVDGSGRAAVASLGAFLSNLEVAAGDAGRACDVAWDGAEARVELRSAPRRPYPVERLGARATHRAPMPTDALDAPVVAALAEPAGATQVRFLAHGTPEHARLVEATLAGARAQLDREEARAELARWIRWSDDDAVDRRDGYTLRSLGITGMAAFWVERVLGPRAVLDPSFRSRSIARTEELVRGAAGYLVFSTERDDAAARLDAGARMQRSFLLARELGVGFHPMAQAVEEGDPSALGALLGGGVVQQVARVGRADAPRPSTFRRPVAAFVRRGSQP